VFICRADGTDEQLDKTVPIELGTVVYCVLRAIRENRGSKVCRASSNIRLSSAIRILRSDGWACHPG